MLAESATGGRVARDASAAGARWGYAWVVVAAALLTVSVEFGTRAAFGVALVGLVETLHWGRGITAGALSVNALLRGAAAVPLGALLDRWGPRPVFTGAALLAGL